MHRTQGLVDVLQPRCQHPAGMFHLPSLHLTRTAIVFLLIPPPAFCYFFYCCGGTRLPIFSRGLLIHSVCSSRACALMLTPVHGRLHQDPNLRGSHTITVTSSTFLRTSQAAAFCHTAPPRCAAKGGLRVLKMYLWSKKENKKRTMCGSGKWLHNTGSRR